MRPCSWPSSSTASRDGARRVDRQPRPPARPRRALRRGGRSRCSQESWATSLARRAAGNLADFDVLVSRDRDTIARLRRELDEPDPVIVPHLDEDIQDLAGLARIADISSPERAVARLTELIESACGAWLLPLSLASDRQRALRELIEGMPRGTGPVLGDRRSRPAPPSASSAHLRHRQQLVREQREVRIEMTADHVAQQRPADGRRHPARGSVPAACSSAVPAITARSKRLRVGHSLGQLRAILRRRAQRRDPPRQQAARRPLRLEQRAQRQQVIAQRLIGAAHARNPARSAAAPRPARCRAGRGARRGCRIARSSSSCSVLTTSIPCGRPPAPSATGFHEPGAVPAPTRARRASRGHRRTGAARAADPRAPRDRARAPRPVAIVGGEHHEQVVPRGTVGHAAQRALLGDRQALRQCELLGGDRQPVQRRQQRHLARARAAPTARASPRPPPRAPGIGRRPSGGRSRSAHRTRPPAATSAPCPRAA